MVSGFQKMQVDTHLRVLQGLKESWEKSIDKEFIYSGLVSGLVLSCGMRKAKAVEFLKILADVEVLNFNEEEVKKKAEATKVKVNVEKLDFWIKELNISLIA